jgi:hypothetical protein
MVLMRILTVAADGVHAPEEKLALKKHPDSHPDATLQCSCSGRMLLVDL